MEHNKSIIFTLMFILLMSFGSANGDPNSQFNSLSGSGSNLFYNMLYESANNDIMTVFSAQGGSPTTPIICDPDNDGINEVISFEQGDSYITIHEFNDDSITSREIDLPGSYTVLDLDCMYVSFSQTQLTLIMRSSAISDLHKVASYTVSPTSDTMTQTKEYYESDETPVFFNVTQSPSENTPITRLSCAPTDDVCFFTTYKATEDWDGNGDIENGGVIMLDYDATDPYDFVFVYTEDEGSFMSSKQYFTNERYQAGATDLSDTKGVREEIIFNAPYIFLETYDGSTNYITKLRYREFGESSSSYNDGDENIGLKLISFNYANSHPFAGYYVRLDDLDHTSTANDFGPMTIFAQSYGGFDGGYTGSYTGFVLQRAYSTGTDYQGINEFPYNLDFESSLETLNFYNTSTLANTGVVYSTPLFSIDIDGNYDSDTGVDELCYAYGDDSAIDYSVCVGYDDDNLFSASRVEMKVFPNNATNVEYPVGAGLINNYERILTYDIETGDYKFYDGDSFSNGYPISFSSEPRGLVKFDDLNGDQINEIIFVSDTITYIATSTQTQNTGTLYGLYDFYTQDNCIDNQNVTLLATECQGSSLFCNYNLEYETTRERLCSTCGGTQSSDNCGDLSGSNPFVTCSNISSESVQEITVNLYSTNIGNPDLLDYIDSYSVNMTFSNDNSTCNPSEYYVGLTALGGEDADDVLDNITSESSQETYDNPDDLINDILGEGSSLWKIIIGIGIVLGLTITVAQSYRNMPPFIIGLVAVMATILVTALGLLPAYILILIIMLSVIMIVLAKMTSGGD